MDLDDSKFQILSEHYTHTFDFLQTYLKRRDRLFIGILLLLIVMLFQIYTPKETSELITQLITNKLDLKSSINFLYTQSIIWFVLLSVIIKYFQSVIFIERQYKYIHSLEDLLSKSYGGKAFTREGESYLNDYPKFLNWASFLYTILFPAILFTITGAKIIGEFRQYRFNELLIWFNGLIFIFITISLGLYLWVIHFNKKGH